MAHAVRLHVNIDHVATLRQQRDTKYPDPVAAAVLCELAGADGITVHLREDRRHIQDRDVRVLRDTVRVIFNLEMALTPEMLDIACAIKPDVCTLVPEQRHERTTEGGLDVPSAGATLRDGVSRLREAGIDVSLFIDPTPAAVEASKHVGASTVELHTGDYCHAPLLSRASDEELARLFQAAQAAETHKLKLAAGHGLDYLNVARVAALPNLEELNIGHALVARAVLVGMDAAVREMRSAIAAGVRSGAE
jgi:pyridoxine 5-phosphate synthase